MVNYLLKSEKSWDLVLVGSSSCVLKIQYSGSAGLMLLPGKVFTLYVFTVLGLGCQTEVQGNVLLIRR